VPQLPDRLSDQEFWRLTVDLSEPDGTFFADNLVSNELSFLQVVPQLRETVPTRGVYLGVGPEQNFSYLAAIRARMGFVVDIRRDNLVLHLMYKALFELSDDRAAFVARLFSRPRPSRLTPQSSGAELMQAVLDTPRGSDELLRRHVQDLRRVLVERFGMGLSPDDLDGIERMSRLFHVHGPYISYTTTHATPLVGRATYATLMAQTDADRNGLSYLATESAFRFIKDLQSRNLIVPVVGNFAGPRALRAIGAYLTDRGATVDAFYVSNVEDYLGLALVPANGDWQDFCRNVAALPLDDRSVFIRPLGLAAIAADGSLDVTAPIQFDALRDTVTYPAGSHPLLPSALSPIMKDIARCSGVHQPSVDQDK
jgi:hypothetical protein